MGAEREPLLARDARNAMLQTLVALLLGTAEQRPLLLVVEDLHWADPTTVELLERIVARAEELPVACVLTFREDFEPSWSQWQPAVEIELDRSARRTYGRWPRRRARRARRGRPPTVQATADGVPLFVEEMVKVLEAPQPGARRALCTCRFPRRSRVC